MPSGISGPSRGPGDLSQARMDRRPSETGQDDDLDDVRSNPNRSVTLGPQIEIEHPSIPIYVATIPQ